MRKGLLHLKRADPVMAGIIERVGRYAIQYHPPEFQTLVRSIVFQQLSGKVARVIYQRLAAAAGNGAVTAEGILRLSEEEMRALGLSRQKMAYIRDLAERTACGSLDFPSLCQLPDEEIASRLTEVKGIGVWTVQMFLIFALRRPDVLPTGDLGIRAAVKKAYNLPELPKPTELARIGEPWRPFCSVASWYLWRSLENQAEL